MNKEAQIVLKRVLEQNIDFVLVHEDKNERYFVPNNFRYELRFGNDERIEIDRLSFLELVELFNLDVKEVKDE